MNPGSTALELSKERLSAALDGMADRVGATLDTCEPRFPLYVADDGRWYTTLDGNWGAGHWIGLLWIASKRAGDPDTRLRFTTAARTHIKRLMRQPLGHIFAGLNHYYAGFFGLDIDGDDELRVLGMRGADAMLRLYDPVAEQIPIGRYSIEPSGDSDRDEIESGQWDLDHMAAVDVIHTSVPILWRAYAESGDPRYYETAVAHLRRHMEWHIRSDGSTTQLRPYNPVSGVPDTPINDLAESQDGCWARGLGWNIGGLADAYIATGDSSVLQALQRSVNYYLAHSQADLVPTWDLTCTGSDAPRDSSAAAVTAYGLLKLAACRDPATGELQQVGARILSALVSGYLVANAGAARRGGVLHGCYWYPHGVAIDSELICTNFYTAAALDLVVTEFGG